MSGDPEPASAGAGAEPRARDSCRTRCAANATSVDRGGDRRAVLQDDAGILRVAERAVSPRQPPTATPHLLVRLLRKSDMSVGDQSRSQLAGRGRSFFQLLCHRMHVTSVAPPRQWMFPEGLLK